MLADHLPAPLPTSPNTVSCAGQMDQLRKTADEKSCNLSGDVSWVSGPPAIRAEFEFGLGIVNDYPSLTRALLAPFGIAAIMIVFWSSTIE